MEIELTVQAEIAYLEKRMKDLLPTAMTQSTLSRLKELVLVARLSRKNLQRELALIAQEPSEDTLRTARLLKLQSRYLAFISHVALLVGQAARERSQRADRRFAKPA
ncbi:MAG: hypothetical protein EOP05_06440 [Proteobacteria bacterium]|nr:MAG: hypothetical protein EOP05_06440 [Pseudomonadota bacterium]